MDKHKKLVKQNELRRLMKARATSGEVEKVTSPLAKYDGQNNLSCVICKAPVKSATAWKVHINSQKHKQNLHASKILLQEGLKKDANSLKTKISSQPQKPAIDEKQNQEKYVKTGKQEVLEPSEENSHKEASKNKDALPENFFDPKPQSKTDLKDSVQEEWERFQKEIKEESLASKAIIAEEHEVATVDRQLEEIDEQIFLWSKVVSLEDKKKMLNFEHVKKSTNVNQVESDSGDDDNDTFEEFSNWRCKKFDIH